MIGRNSMSGNDFHARDEILHSVRERARRDSAAAPNFTRLRDLERASEYCATPS
jgi:hypothetical protein